VGLQPIPTPIVVSVFYSLLDGGILLWEGHLVMGNLQPATYYGKTVVFFISNMYSCSRVPQHMDVTDRGMPTGLDSLNDEITRGLHINRGYRVTQRARPAWRRRHVQVGNKYSNTQN